MPADLPLPALDPDRRRGGGDADSSADRQPAAAARLAYWRWPWPLPALLIWGAAWFATLGLAGAGVAEPVAALAAAGLGAALAIPVGPWRRRLIAAAGFPLAGLLTGGAGALPAWVWALALVPLAAIYPLRAWRDAPLFPTPADALIGLDAVVRPAPRRVVDAGAGLGHGLVALRRVWPQAGLTGLEWSRPLARLAAWRCPWARVERADMWAADWSGADLVYLFQRPESMARAHAKARAEMRAGAWLVSLEFAVPGVAPVACLRDAAQRPVWVYRVGDAPGAGGATEFAPGRAADARQRPRRADRRSTGAGAGR